MRAAKHLHSFNVNHVDQLPLHNWHEHVIHINGDAGVGSEGVVLLTDTPDKQRAIVGRTPGPIEVYVRREKGQIIQAPNLE